MSDPRVCVLMSTYNGEKYIDEQINSILAQKGVDITLLIRDDGSSDSTCSIVEDIAGRNSNVVFYQGRNAGVGKSFMDLIHRSPDADYYAFADQDDYWNDDKLIRGVTVIRSIEHSSAAREKRGKGYPVIASEETMKEGIGAADGREAVPALYGSNQTLVNGDLEYIGAHYIDIPACDIYSCLTRNVIFGCTMVWNRELNDIVRRFRLPADLVMKRKFHDSWLLYCAQICGVFVYDHESRMLYRQHAGNVVGGMQLRGLDFIRDKWRRLTKADNKGLRSILARELMEIPSEYLDSDVACHLRVVKDANSPIGAHRLLKDPVVRPTLHESSFKVALRCLLGWM